MYIRSACIVMCCVQHDLIKLSWYFQIFLTIKFYKQNKEKKNASKS